MPIFGGPPNVRKLHKKRDVAGLVKALSYKDDTQVRVEAALALVAYGKDPDRSEIIEALVGALHDRKSVAIQAAQSLGGIRAVEASARIAANIGPRRPKVNSAILLVLEALGATEEVARIASRPQDHPGLSKSAFKYFLKRPHELGTKAALVTAAQVCEASGFRPSSLPAQATLLVLDDKFEEAAALGPDAIRPLLSRMGVAVARHPNRRGVHRAQADRSAIESAKVALLGVRGDVIPPLCEFFLRVKARSLHNLFTMKGSRGWTALRMLKSRTNRQDERLQAVRDHFRKSGTKDLKILAL